jgi:hypothetical protein
MSTDSCCPPHATSKYIHSEGLDISKCTSCGILWGDHARRPDGRAWDESYIPEHFARALKLRRERQASTLVALLAKAGASTHHGGRILDYGTGQGVFLAATLRQNMDAFGCDLDANAPMSVAPRDRILHLTEPWAIPEGQWSTIVMLDVLEHHHDPVAFLSSLPCELVLLKVPNATGPAARLARLAARFGRTGLLEQLFLVGENFPHRWLATRRGLRSMAERAGYEVVLERALVEVGLELPDRMRGEAGWAKRLVLKVAGTALGLLGTFWSDASVIVLRRRRASASGSSQ